MTEDADPRTSRRSAASAWDDGDGAAAETGVPGAHAPADRPLPPLPDGGLAAAMPDWLRGDPELGGSAGNDGAGPGMRPVGEVIDPTTFLTEDDLPDWLRRLAAGSGGGAAVGGPASFAGGTGRAVPAAAIRDSPVPLRRGTTDPAPDPPRRPTSADHAGGEGGPDRRSGPSPVAAAPRAAEPLPPTAPRPAPRLGRTMPATGEARALRIAVALLLVLILVLLIVTVR